MDPETIIIIDASYWAHSAHHVSHGLKRSDGQPIGATYGFMRTLLNFLHAPPADFSHIVACFDMAGETWRHRVMPEYKEARRKRHVERANGSSALFSQWGFIHESCEVLGVPAVWLEGVEADDIIATYTRLAEAEGMKVIVVSADKDLLQLVRPGVRVYDPHPAAKANRWRDVGDVVSMYGVLPERIPDFLALVGDVADSIPGVMGIGPIKAADLIAEHGDVEGIISHFTSPSAKVRDLSGLIARAITANIDQIRKARIVAGLFARVDVPRNIESLFWRGIDFPRANAFFDRHEFVSLARQIEGLLALAEKEPDMPDPNENGAAGQEAPAESEANAAAQGGATADPPKGVGAAGVGQEADPAPAESPNGE